MDNTVLITFDAAKTIIKTATGSPVETGGILVGTLEPSVVILQAGEPGENAIKRATSFTSDAQSDSNCLKRIRQLYGAAVVPVGWWHKHPSDFDRPSSGDCGQVRKLSDRYNDGRPVLMGIVNNVQRTFRYKTTLKLFSIDSADKLQQHNWKLVNKKSKDLLDILSRAPKIAGTRQCSYWTDPDFRSYVNPIGRQRIQRDILELKNRHWQVQQLRSRHDQMLILNLSNDHCDLKLIFPPEYPINPPAILTGNGNAIHGIKTIYTWNSQTNLADIANEAVEILMCSKCRRYCVNN